MSTTGEQIVHGRYCKRYGVFCTGANESGECNATACWNSTARTAEQERMVKKMNMCGDERLEIIDTAPTVDADALPRHKQLEAFGNGQYEEVDIVYGNDIDNAPTIDIKTINAYSAGYEQGRFDEAVRSGQYGRWERSNADDENIISCSVCGFADSIEFGEPYKYCPNCGARMDGGKLNGTD